jgi:hypothetical protein
MKNLLSVCRVDLDICMPYELLHACIANIFLWHPFDSRHKYHIVFGTNRI